MKHCKNCENCVSDPLTLYLKGIDYYKCVVDGHRIDEPWWEKCEKYKRDKYKHDKCGSFLYEIVRMCRK